MKQKKATQNIIKEFSASKLLAKLARLDENTKYHTILAIKANTDTGNALGIEYTPMTTKLAQYHGMLGEMLHYKFFLNNTFWYRKDSLEKHNHRSIADYRKFLNDVVNEFAACTKGKLLSPPGFIEWIDALDCD